MPHKWNKRFTTRTKQKEIKRKINQKIVHQKRGKGNKPEDRTEYKQKIFMSFFADDSTTPRLQLFI